LIAPEHRRGLAGQTDWHQDRGVALPEADQSHVLTVWMPITDATEENGCMRVVPYSHRADQLATHCPGGIDGGLHIPEKLLPSAPVALPMKRGSVLFMHGQTMHSSLPNVSNDIRWSFDLRYQPIGEPTGRPQFPNFVARSLAHPEDVVTDYRVWQQAWYDARARLSPEPTPQFYRWDGNAPACA
jgi:ectoine hydroxylase-related dioxygenase (phytanoyl-CoA dioxygenase family)